MSLAQDNQSRAASPVATGPEQSHLPLTVPTVLEQIAYWTRPPVPTELKLEPQRLDDWSGLRRLAHDHGVLALVVDRWLTHARARLLPEVRADMEQRQAAGIARSEHMAREVVSVVDMLQKAGIQAIPFKGPVLAFQAHGAIHRRDYDDLDFILRRKDIEAAAGILAGRGYRPCLPLSPSRLRRQIRLGWGCSLFSPDHSHRIELDGGVLPFYQDLDLSEDAIWRGVSLTPFLDSSVPGFAAEIQLLLLAIHGTKHLWKRLIWVADISALIHRHPDLDWARLLTLAEATGTRRMLLLALGLTHELHVTSLPPPVRESMRQDGMLDEALRLALSHMASEQDRSRKQEIAFHLLAREKPSHRLRYIMRQALTPSHADLDAIRLPSALFALYYLIRPIRILFCLLSRGSVQPAETS